MFSLRLLAPSVTRVAICVSRAFRSTEEKRETARSLHKCLNQSKRIKTDYASLVQEPLIEKRANLKTKQINLANNINSNNNSLSLW